MGLGLRVSVRDILKGRQRDCTPVRTMVKRLGVKRLKDRVTGTVRKGPETKGTGKGGKQKERETETVRMRSKKKGPETGSRAAGIAGEGLRRSQRLKSIQGKDAWCIWCGVGCRGGRGTEKGCAGRGGGRQGLRR